MKISRFLSLVLGLSVATVTLAGPRQVVPDKKRTVEIQEALIAKGYLTGSPTGKWDSKTIRTLKQIAETHKWQVTYVPDARVLILLDLSSGDPTVIVPGAMLDKAQRAYTLEHPKK